MRTTHRTAAFAAAMILAGGPAAAQRVVPACCDVTAVDLGAGVATARIKASGQVFQFKTNDARLLPTIRAGQAVYANFSLSQVSLDGRTVCCAITSGPQAPAAAAAPSRPSAPPAAPPPAPPANPAPASAPSRPAPPPPAPGPVTAAPRTVAIAAALPAAAYGPPLPAAPLRGDVSRRVEASTLTSAVSGRSVSTPLLHLRGRKAIEEAPASLPDGARRLLLMHVGTVPKEQSDHYIVNTQLAAQWIAQHPVPDYVKPEKPASNDCDNWYDSFDCAGQAVSDEWERNWKKAKKAWDDATGRLADEWSAAAGCFADHRLPLPSLPVRFDVEPTFTVNMSSSGGRGAASGTVAGSVGLGVPMQADFAAQLDLFYIPCLPFVVRPRSLSADGSLSVGERLTANVSATGAFDKTFTIPPSGGPVIPIQVFPIIIGGVPVAVLDVSAYIEGNVQVSADGKADGGFQLLNMHPTRFAFDCDGGGCSGTSKGMSGPVTTNEAGRIEGTVSVRPAIYTALQLNFNYQALSARAGPQPYLLAAGQGCGAFTASQTAGGPSTAQGNYALTADLDWGAELRAEALVLGKIVGDPWTTRLMADRHLWFRDLAPGGSTALAAVVDSTGPAVAGQPVRFKVRMPTCYPYPDRVQYRVTWTGGAAPVPNPACQWQAGQGTCSFLPASDLVIALTWPAAGSHALTVAPVRDSHPRVFNPAPAPTRVSVTVAQPGGP